MNYYSKNKWFIISLITLLLPAIPALYLFSQYFTLERSNLFYAILPIYLIIISGIYYCTALLIAVITYKLHKPLKEGTYSIHSSEMQSWMAAQFVMQVIGMLKNLQLPNALLRRFYNNVFKTKMQKIMILSGYVEHPLVNIGSNAIIGQESMIIGHLIENDKIYIKRVSIGNNCTIGAKSIIMPGAVIKDNTIIGALTLVPKNKVLGPDAVYLGIPARKVKDLKRNEF